MNYSMCRSEDKFQELVFFFHHVSLILSVGGITVKKIVSIESNAVGDSELGLETPRHQ